MPPVLSTNHMVISKLIPVPEVLRTWFAGGTSMAPSLAESQHVQIHAMIRRKRPPTEIADAATCSKRGVYRIKKNLEKFGTTRAPSIGVGRPRSITPEIVDALLAHLQDEPDLYYHEMVEFVWKHFRVHVNISSVRRALTSRNWSKKKMRRVAKAQNADLRDLHTHNTSHIRSWQYVFVDESGCDKRAGERRSGWAPRGVTPIKVSRFQREQRYQILPAYTQDGVIFSRVYQGTTDSAFFEDFVEQLLPSMNPWPGPNSVLVMDNAPIHHTERIKQMCRDARVKLVYLPPYSPDFNPIEEFFAELKDFIKLSWHNYEEHPRMGFDNFLKWCINVVGKKKESARGHFRHAGIKIEEP
jgi:transposase